MKLLFIAARNTPACVFNDTKYRKLKRKNIYTKKPKCPYYMKCVSCDHIADVPDWIIGEFAEEEDGIKGSEVEIECPACNGP